MTTSTTGAAQTSDDAAKGNEGTGQPGAAASATKSTAPAEVVIKRHGKDIPLPLERVRDLASKGYDYETRSTELKRDEKQYAEFKDLQSRLAANPALREAVSKAFENPDEVLRSIKTQPAAPKDADSDGDDGAETRAPVADRGQSELVNRIRGLEERLSQVLEKDRNSDNVRSMDAEIKSFPWVAENVAASRFVREYVNAKVHAGSTEPIAVLVGEAAADVRDMIVEQDRSRIARAERDKQFGTSDTRKGSPVTTPAPKLDKNSFRDGTFQAALRQRTKELLGQDV